MSYLENEEIRLRALEPEDLVALYAWENADMFWADGNTIVPYSRYILKQYIEQQQSLDIFTSKQLRLMIELKQAHQVIGTIDLFDFDPYHSRAGVGILVDRAYQKQGLASQALSLLCGYAFQMLKIHQLYCHINENNRASIQLFKKVGFTASGCLKAWNRGVEGWQDCLIFQRINL